MRILYLDCFSGISGDMTLGSLVHLGADRHSIEQELSKLGLEQEYTLVWKSVVKKGIAALKADVIVRDGREQAGPPHGHKHGASHKHSHRRYADIVHLIERAELPVRAAKLSLAIFEKIGAAEAKIHDIPLEDVVFHEVGAVDSIIDIVGAALAIDQLNPDRIVSSPIPLGSGVVRIEHGMYPVPAPATLEMMRGLPIAPSNHEVELTTPTGAGIIAAVVDEFSPSLPPMIVEAIGYGAGTRELPNQPNVLRSVIGIYEKRLAVWPAPHAEHLESAHGHNEHHHRGQ